MGGKRTLFTWTNNQGNRDQGREISETTAGIHNWIQSEEPTAIDRRPNIIRVHTCLLSNMNHPAYTTGTLCRTLSADHNTMINALNSLYSFIPPSLSIKLTSRSLSKLKSWGTVYWTETSIHPPQYTAILHPCRQDRHHSSDASSTMCPTPQTHPALHTSSPAQASKQIRNSIVEGIVSPPDRSPPPGDSFFQ